MTAGFALDVTVDGIVASAVRGVRELRLVKRSVSVGIVFVALSTLLTGCDIGVNSDGPVSIRRDGESLLVAVCADYEATGVYIEERPSGSGAKWSMIWDGSGQISLQAGEILSTDSNEPPTFAVEKKSTPELASNSEIGVLITGTSDNQQFISAGFRIGESGLSQTMWLRPNGTLSVEPCATG